MRVSDSGFRVQGSGFKVWGSGFRVEGQPHVKPYSRTPTPKTKPLPEPSELRVYRDPVVPREAKGLDRARVFDPKRPQRLWHSAAPRHHLRPPHHIRTDMGAQAAVQLRGTGGSEVGKMAEVSIPARPHRMC